MLVESPDISVRPSSGAGIYENATATIPFIFEQVCRIILIHGFRNSEADALDSYSHFKYYFAQFAGVFSQKVFSFVWPGDYVGANLLKYFEYNVQNSLEAGRVLGRLLIDLASRQNPTCQFIIVAHSLGCRLTAAMIKEIHTADVDLCRRFKIVFMAGAVPCTDIADPGMFRGGLEGTAYVANLYSSNDGTLRLWFPVGEVGGGRSASEPIGLHGGPDSFKWSERREMAGFDHPDYWRKSPAAEFIARLVGTNIDRELPTNEPISNSPSNHKIM